MYFSLQYVEFSQAKFENLKLSNAEGQNADGGGQHEPFVKGDAGGGLRAVGSNSCWDQYQVEEPLDAKLQCRFTKALIHRQLVSSEMIWAEKCELFAVNTDLTKWDLHTAGGKN